MTNNFTSKERNKLKYFIGNWKMFGDLNSFKIVERIRHFYTKFRKSNKKSKIILCIPSTLIGFYKKKMNSKIILLGAQNCSHHKNYGAFTGSISALMLKKAGAKFVILGHSENRKEGETSQLIKKKIESVLNENLNVIFCVGETAKEKKEGKTLSVLYNQLRKSIDKRFDLNKIIFAYEPVWSIGTGKTPNILYLQKNTMYIKNFFRTKKYINVLYGGSVNDKNIKEFSKFAPFMDGFLIGGASQSSKKFIDIIKNYYK